MTDSTPLGATIDGDGVTFAVWAPNAATAVTLMLAEPLGDRVIPMVQGEAGLWTVRVTGIGAGARYRFQVDHQPPFPDPYSRYQPEGVHGPSEVIDPSAFSWTDAGWHGPDPGTLAIYELHVGTMTPEGTFEALTRELPYLAALGITAIELMPVAQAPGRWNWGYDGVDLFAPSNAYGTPDDLRKLVDEAHGLGLAVMLDVVYNHFGPEGAYQGAFAREYFSEVHETSWGSGLNWDGPASVWVRRYAIDNACMWIREYHLDGLRLDATHALIDDSDNHIVRDLTAAARAAAGDRRIVVHAEDGRHEITRAWPVERGGDGVDGIWADDFHHELRVMLTNAHENYYAHYDGSMTALAAAINDGFGPVTTSRSDVTAVTDDDQASKFVFCIQNHDQVGNRPFGDRLHHEIAFDRYAVASSTLLFAPETPLIFMGQEFAASTPFLYFTDHPDELGRLVTEGRRNEFAGFGAFQHEDLRETIPDPQAESTFSGSKLRLEERSRHAGIHRLYRDLLHQRLDDPVLRHNDRATTHAQAIAADLLAVHRWWDGAHRLLLANIGADRVMDLGAIAGLPALDWTVALSTSDERYDGCGDPVTIDGRQVVIPARTAVILAAAE